MKTPEALHGGFISRLHHQRHTHQRRRTTEMKRMVLGIAVLAAVLTLVACGDGNGSSSSATEAGEAGETPPAGSDLPQGSEPVELDPADFTVEIDNPYWPMDPGTRWTYRETDEEGRVLEVVVTVTSETKEIANGITARVVRDTVTEDGELIEDTFDWYAQDSQGNIWYLGEDTAEFEGGEVTTTAGSWEAGVDGALPGVLLPANPVDDMTYRQEYYAGEAEDNGEVLSVEEQVEVPFGHFDGVLLTKDTSALEPDVLEYKLYARDIGVALALGVSGGGGREELLEMEQIDAGAAQAAGTTPLGEAYP
jgi:hypothetical protein